MDFPKNLKCILLDFDETLVTPVQTNYSRLRARMYQLLQKNNISSEKRISVMLGSTQNKKIKTLLHTYIDEEEDIGVRSVKPYVGVRKLLLYLNKKKIKFVIFSRNGSKAIRKVFDKFDLPQPMLYATRDKIGRFKPHPSHLNYVIQETGISKFNMLLIGDPPTDAITSQRNRLPAIIFLNPQKRKYLTVKSGKTICKVCTSHKDILSFLKQKI